MRKCQTQKIGARHFSSLITWGLENRSCCQNYSSVDDIYAGLGFLDQAKVGWHKIQKSEILISEGPEKDGSTGSKTSTLASIKTTKRSFYGSLKKLRSHYE
jgi:hypothetical protein